MSNIPILSDNPLWSALHAKWVEEKKPGFILDLSGQMYRVIAATDDDIQFHPMAGSIDGMYGQRSTSTVIK